MNLIFPSKDNDNACTRKILKATQYDDPLIIYKELKRIRKLNKHTVCFKGLTNAVNFFYEYYPIYLYYNSIKKNHENNLLCLDYNDKVISFDKQFLQHISKYYTVKFIMFNVYGKNLKKENLTIIKIDEDIREHIEEVRLSLFGPKKKMVQKFS
jgi:hypothetical protein